MENVRVIDISDAVLRFGYYARHGLWLAFWTAAIVVYAVLLVGLEWVFSELGLATDYAVPAMLALPTVVIAAAFYALKVQSKRFRFPWPRLFQFDTWDRPSAITGLDAGATLSALKAHARPFPRWKYLLKPRRPVVAIVLLLSAAAAAVAAFWGLMSLYASSDEVRSLLKLGLKLPFLREAIAVVVAFIPVALGYLALSWLATDASNIVRAEAGSYFILLRAFSRDEFAVREPEVRRFAVGYDESRLEDVIARCVKRAVPLIAIGDPTEELPTLGANRAYFSNVEWQQKLQEWLEKANGAIVLLGGGRYLDWEIIQLQKRSLLDRSIFFFPDATTTGENLAKLALVDGDARLASACASSAPDRRILALLLGSDGRHTIVVSKSEFRTDYELACKLCLGLILQRMHGR